MFGNREGSECGFRLPHRNFGSMCYKFGDIVFYWPAPGADCYGPVSVGAYLTRRFLGLRFVVMRRQKQEACLLTMTRQVSLGFADNGAKRQRQNIVCYICKVYILNMLLLSYVWFRQACVFASVKRHTNGCGKKTDKCVRQIIFSLRQFLSQTNVYASQAP